MTKEEFIAFINTWANTATDAFTNQRMKTMLLQLANGTIVSNLETGVEFQQAVAANPDLAIMAYVANDTVYTKQRDVVLWRIPGRGVGQIAIDFITDER